MQYRYSRVRKINPDTNKLVKKSDYNDKVSELEYKITSISGLVTTSELTAVENKIPTVSNLVKKTDYDTKITEPEMKLTDHNHDKYITTPEFDKLTAENFPTRLTQVNLITKKDFDAKLNCQVLIEKLFQIKQKIYLYKIN